MSSQLGTAFLRVQFPNMYYSLTVTHRLMLEFGFMDMMILISRYES